MGSLISVGNVGLFSKNTGNDSGDFSHNTSISRSGNSGRESKREREHGHRGGHHGKGGHRRHSCDD